MNSFQIRQTFLDFFKKRGHAVVSSSSLVPADPSVLFTTAGMQQFKPYFLGEKPPYGNRVASCQKCLRTSDIENVGNESHLTFFEMLGNFSFAVSAGASGKGGDDYFKKEAIELAFELLTSIYKLSASRLWITYFKGDKEVSEDRETPKIWQNLGFPKERIHGFSRTDNFWGPTGEEGPCGPTSEIHYDISQTSCFRGGACLPNCSCGRFIEIWNLVFNEYYCDKRKILKPLKQRGVDTGMGLERLAVVLQGKTSVFDIDLFWPIITEIEAVSSKPYLAASKPYRIIADHLKGSVFLISEGILPSNLDRGYILRRLLRRAIRYGKLTGASQGFLISLAEKVIEIYQDVYPGVRTRQADILTVIQNEEEKFEKTLEKGLSQLEKLLKLKIKYQKSKMIEGNEAFDLYQSCGFPLELTKELAREEGFEVDVMGFQDEFKKHQEISRLGAERKFGGHDIEKIKDKELRIKITKLHTATHLLHQALREILGKEVKQMGSDITEERLRFDFSHSQKMSSEEIKKVEDLVNQKIKENLPVKKEEMKYREAVKSGALAFFKEKYPEKVSVYSIGSFSKEICAGPHAERTGELGHFKILKEEACQAGTRRIKATLMEIR